MPAQPSPARTRAETEPPAPRFGPLGRLGLLTAEHALAGAGGEASGSESVAARDVVQREFGGMSSAALQVVVHSETGPVLRGHRQHPRDGASR